MKKLLLLILVMLLVVANVNGSIQNYSFSFVGAVDITGLTGNVATPTTIVTPPANGFYRISCYENMTTAASTSSTLPECDVSYTDPDSGVAENPAVANLNSFNSVGATVRGSIVIYAKGGVPIQYSTSSYASSAAGMTYSLHIRLEGPAF